MPGNVLETYFEKDCNTSWVIDALEKKSDKYTYDTLKLCRVFRLRLINPTDNSSENYSVSLYIKRDEDCSDSSFDSKLTLSKIKKIYAEKQFQQAEAEDDFLLSALLNRVVSFDWEQIIQDIMFESTITFRAQALANWNERGKLKTYHIAGISLEKITKDFKRLKFTI
jgi:hypothetical protein